MLLPSSPRASAAASGPAHGNRRKAASEMPDQSLTQSLSLVPTLPAGPQYREALGTLDTAHDYVETVEVALRRYIEDVVGADADSTPTLEDIGRLYSFIESVEAGAGNIATLVAALREHLSQLDSARLDADFRSRHS